MGRMSFWKLGSDTVYVINPDGTVTGMDRIKSFGFTESESNITNEITEEDSASLDDFLNQFKRI